MMHGPINISNVNCFDFLFFSVFVMDLVGGKPTVSLKELR